MQTPSTTALGLNQWQPNDPINTIQFNEDNRIISAALDVRNTNIVLAAGAWTQSGSIFEQTITNALFTANGYLYRVSTAPDQLFAAGDLGGVAMISVSDGQAVFQCRQQPDADIVMQIERAARREEA